MAKILQMNTIVNHEHWQEFLTWLVSTFELPESTLEQHEMYGQLKLPSSGVMATDARSIAGSASDAATIFEFEVDDLEHAVEKALKAGAEIITEPTEVQATGSHAALSTPQGIRLWLWQHAPARDAALAQSDVKQWQQMVLMADKALQNAIERYASVLRARPVEVVDDFELQSSEGPVQLSQLFGQNDDLILVHNMGSHCPYCTMWADGFNGVLEHLESRAAFVVASPDSTEVQNAFAESRGWRFRMVSTQESDFSLQMGYQTKDGLQIPGASAFRRKPDGTIERVATTWFGPRDLYSSPWHLFDLLPGASANWAPRIMYNEE